MDSQLTRNSFAAKLEDKVVYTTLNNVSLEAKMWKKGGSINHRIVGFGYATETGANNIQLGKTCINTDSTFGKLRTTDKQMYDGTVDILYSLYQWNVYIP